MEHEELASRVVAEMAGFERKGQLGCIRVQPGQGFPHERHRDWVQRSAMIYLRLADVVKVSRSLYEMLPTDIPALHVQLTFAWGVGCGARRLLCTAA
jgi:hypothetical protein